MRGEYIKRIIFIFTACTGITLLGAETTQTVSSFAFFLQNCFVGGAEGSCLHTARATYHPPLIKQENFNTKGDTIIQEASTLQIIAQNCTCL